MTLTRRDAAATVLAGLAVLVYLANVGGWNVPLIDGNRWAVAALGLLGIAMCSVGARLEQPWTGTMVALGVLGVAALALLVLGLIVGSQGLLTGLLVVLLALWAGATIRHAPGHAAGRTIGAA